MNPDQLCIKDDDSFWVLLGEDPQSGMFGCSETHAKALEGWHQHFNQRLAGHEMNDDLVQYIEKIARQVKKIRGNQKRFFKILLLAAAIFLSRTPLNKSLFLKASC